MGRIVKKISGKKFWEIWLYESYYLSLSDEY